MWCVVGEIEEKRVGGLCLRLDEFSAPFGEEVCGVSARVDCLKVVSHVVYIVPKVRVVVVHHVAKEAVKMVKASLAWMVLRFKSKMPLADECGVIVLLFQGCRKCGCVLSKVAPTVFWVGTDDTRNASTVRITSRHERGSTRRTDRGICVELRKPGATCGNPVDVWCLN